MRAHRIRALLMGGQACVLYGAAQFSRDVDLVVLADEKNLQRLRSALNELRAENIAVPPLDAKFLRRGHAVHFRCGVSGAAGLRVDIMTKMRGVDSFSKLWKRRTEVVDQSGFKWQLLSLPDLVAAKKTQRDKDWPMIRGLMEAHYFSNQSGPTRKIREFWLREMRTPELLLEICAQNEMPARKLSKNRVALKAALAGNRKLLQQKLLLEENRERRADALYWRPLKKELEKLRHLLVKQRRS
jgi:hypothetical protein